MIKRLLESEIKNRLFQKKAIIVTGPRQVGKTTLINKVLDELGRKVIFFDGDDPTVRDLLDTPNTERIREMLIGGEIVFIDEAQRIKNIGLTAKIIIDRFSEQQLILSGSSAFELSHELNESLTGRKWTYHLWPVSWEEFQNNTGYLKSEQNLESRLIYGFYPDVIQNSADKETILFELSDSYLFKDILAFSKIRKPEILQKLVKALAYQIGQEINYKELGDVINSDPKTVSNYIDILEKAFVVFRLSAFSKNLRNEIKKNQKVYFYDNGIRNAVIDDFDPMAERTDRGALWENFLISERLKYLSYAKIRASMYFWRTKQQQEIDYVEFTQERLSGFEFKWNPKKKIKPPLTFERAYNTKVKGVSRENFREFVMPVKDKD